MNQYLIQVRTVFVPPPMNMKAGGGQQSVASFKQNGGGPRLINTFNMQPGGGQPVVSSAASAGITITSRSNGKAASKHRK